MCITCLRLIYISWWVGIGNSIEVFTVDQTFDSFLDHVHFGGETGGELGNYFCNQLGVRKLLSLSVDGMEKFKISVIFLLALEKG